MKKGDLIFFCLVVVPIYIGDIVILFWMDNLIADLVAGILIILGVICLAGALTDLVVWLQKRKKA